MVLLNNPHPEIENGYCNYAVCESLNSKHLFDIPSRKIVKCSDYGHEYVNPLPNPKSIPEYVYFSTGENAIRIKIDLVYLTKIFQRYNTNSGKLLDFGCGQGRLERELIKLGGVPPTIYLVDSSKKDLELAREKCPRFIFICGDAQESMGFSDHFNMRFPHLFLSPSFSIVMGKNDSFN